MKPVRGVLLCDDGTPEDSNDAHANAWVSARDELEGLLKVCGAEDLIGHRTSSDDADESKPDPDIVHAALERIELAPEQVILLGDTPYDVEAGRRAGVRVIAVRCGGWSDDDL